MAVRACRTFLGASVAAFALAATACATSSAPEGLAPPQAAEALARNLELDAAQTSCMQARFEQSPSAAAALATDQAPSDEDRELFLAAIRTCLPPDQFGMTLAATVRSELPDAPDDRATCVQENVVSLPAAEQDRLYLYFANPATLDVAEVGSAGVDLLRSCNLERATGADAGDSSADTTAAP